MHSLQLLFSMLVKVVHHMFGIRKQYLESLAGEVIFSFGKT